MYRIYADEFYADKSKRDTFEKAYIKKICKKAESIRVRDKNTTKRNYSSLKENWEKKFSDLTASSILNSFLAFPKSIEDLLVISPKNMSKIYWEYKHNTSFKKECDKFLRDIWKEAKSKKKKCMIDVNQKLFDYTLFRDVIADFFIEQEIGQQENSLGDGTPQKVFTISTCFYCNMAYINTFSFDKSSKRTYDLDHFIPKGILSLFALSLYNFVPCCQICNSRIKSEKLNFEDLVPKQLECMFLSCKEYDLNGNLKFRVLPASKEALLSMSFLENSRDFYINIDSKDGIQNDEVKNYLKEIESFKITERYTCHKKEFLNYMEKLRKYPPSYFLLYARKNSMKDADGLEEAIFNSKLRKDEKMIFQKMYNDIEEDFI